ncbi:hypothetical protein BT96DRAFT_1021852 [Gymnopus androsaceus JB14]|uniref:Uncharacterized protein n=1 Tax=Gymnopus androsaceus JB14 TaxID=1447944 RepID=A0A6A4HCF1_9AGAR|nr:hypothetical protein BT96DRAFT_1021852 [Gymnopus androsaceus JB14]
MQTPVAIDDFSAQLRFDSFKLGKPLPASMTMAHKHSRSHSRNASISLSTTLPTTNSMPTLASAAASSKRNSHHRRRSSVSTRHESAEIMGVSVPENIWEAKADLDNTEKDSIRRRALWALEGKQVNLDKVEIPETLPTSTSTLTGSLMASSKRDSFKPSSSKDQLHTLVEEEEEEEEDSPVPVTVLPVMPKRTRPATLSLRPLSLIPDVGLPTPSSTPGARPGLKSLSLVPSNPSDDITSPTPSRSRPVLNLHIDSTVDEAAYRPTKRSSISYKSSSSSTSMSSAAGLPTPEMTPTFAERHNSLSLGSNASSSDEDLSPQQTNNANANPSAYSRHRPLSVSEQHFLFKSHNALLMRIQDLEKALSVRRSSMSSVSMSGSGSRPISIAYSIADSEASSEPSDEMLRLVADLKAERDELKRDVDGWRVRVGDLEAQISLLARRIEGERREAWVARSKVGLLEAEKGALERELAQENERLGRECEEWKREVERLRAAERRYTAASLDTDTSLDSSSTEVEEIDFGSFDNGYPLKAVEEEEQLDEDLLDSPQIPQEDIEEDYLSSEEDEDNGLAGYEDEDEDLDEELDLDLTSSSFGSRMARYLLPLLPGSGANTPSTLTPGSRSPSASPTPMDAFKFPRAAPATAPVAAAAPTHRVIGSLSKTWTFPAAAARQQTQTPPSQSRDRDEVDKFFNCLEDSESDSSTAGSRSPVSPYTYDSEHNKGYSLFAKALEAFDEDDVMPFSLPPGVLGAIGEEEQESPRLLDVVFEEEEEGGEEAQVDDNEER